MTNTERMRMLCAMRFFDTALVIMVFCCKWLDWVPGWGCVCEVWGYRFFNSSVKKGGGQFWMPSFSRTLEIQYPDESGSHRNIFLTAQPVIIQIWLINFNLQKNNDCTVEPTFISCKHEFHFNGSLLEWSCFIHINGYV